MSRAEDKRREAALRAEYRAATRAHRCAADGVAMGEAAGMDTTYWQGSLLRNEVRLRDLRRSLRTQLRPPLARRRTGRARRPGFRAPNRRRRTGAATRGDDPPGGPARPPGHSVGGPGGVR